MVGLLNSSCEICNTRKKGSQNAEYHNLMESMATGCTDDETCIDYPLAGDIEKKGKESSEILIVRSGLIRTKES